MSLNPESRALFNDRPIKAKIFESLHYINSQSRPDQVNSRLNGHNANAKLTLTGPEQRSAIPYCTNEIQQQVAHFPSN